MRRAVAAMTAAIDSGGMAAATTSGPSAERNEGGRSSSRDLDDEIPFLKPYQY